MKTENRTQIVHALLLTGEIAPPDIVDGQHQIIIRLSYNNNMYELSARHYVVRNGMGSTRIPIGKPWTRATNAVVGKAGRFSQSQMNKLVNHYHGKNGAEVVEQLVQNVMWNKFHVTGPQCLIDLEFGTVDVKPLTTPAFIDTKLTQHKVEPANGLHWSLHELYEILDCDAIEVVALRNNLILIVDEEGKCKGLPGNHEATDLAHHYDRLQGDVICGPAIVCPTTMLQ